MTNILKKLKSVKNFTADNKLAKVKKSKSSKNNLLHRLDDDVNLPYKVNNPIGFNNNFNNVVNPTIKQISLPEKPTILISKEFKDKVDFLHNKVKSVEWSGVLIYKIIKESIENPSKFVIEMIDIILMDIGSASYTEYSLSKALTEDDYVFDKINSLMNDETLKTGHIHTHHSMSCFFSGTDTKELIDNHTAYNYYLSLIVNFQDIDKWCAKIAFEGEIEENYSRVLKFKKDDGTFGNNSTKKDLKEKAMFTYDCTIKYKEHDVVNLPESFVKRYEEIEKKKSKYTFYPDYNYQSNNNFYGNGRLFQDNELLNNKKTHNYWDNDDDFYVPKLKNKKSKGKLSKETSAINILSDSLDEAILALDLKNIPENMEFTYKFSEFYKHINGTSFDTFSMYSFIECLEEQFEDFCTDEKLSVKEETDLLNQINLKLKALHIKHTLDNVILEEEFRLKSNEK